MQITKQLDSQVADRAAPTTVEELTVKIFADGADIDSIIKLASQSHIKGFTTNPTLMHKAGITDFEAFARELLDAIPNHPVSIEVFSDEPAEMHRQALLISGWGGEREREDPDHEHARRVHRRADP